MDTFSTLLRHNLMACKNCVDSMRSLKKFTRLQFFRMIRCLGNCMLLLECFNNFVYR